MRDGAPSTPESAIVEISSAEEEKAFEELFEAIGLTATLQSVEQNFSELSRAGIKIDIQELEDAIAQGKVEGATRRDVSRFASATGKLTVSYAWFNKMKHKFKIEWMRTHQQGLPTESDRQNRYVEFVTLAEPLVRVAREYYLGSQVEE